MCVHSIGTEFCFGTLGINLAYSIVDGLHIFFSDFPLVKLS